MWIFFRTKINWNNGDKTINNKNFRNLIFRRRKKVYFWSLRSRHSSSAFATNPADKQLYEWVEKGRAHTFILAYYWDMLSHARVEFSEGRVADLIIVGQWSNGCGEMIKWIWGWFSHAFIKKKSIAARQMSLIHRIRFGVFLQYLRETFAGVTHFFFFFFICCIDIFLTLNSLGFVMLQ